ncbi:YHYH protein [Lentisphaera profundi]|uniref:YHYH protein n=1 Tax=Lentisphaera profundi TaxID=1658616 RepID=A0ABY7VUR8_9BACT|nr:YHYH protein [Lentisphaera profundi]WDE97028.1 YHYH protein [Lentisphaera profundi]
MKKIVCGSLFLIQVSLFAHIDGYVEYTKAAQEDFGSLILAISSGKLENKVKITKDDEYIYIETNSIPNHKSTGSSGRNPNSMQETNKSYRVSAQAEINDNLTQSNPNSFGVALNGIPFRPSTAETWNNNRDWVEEAISSRGKRLLGLDSNYGHVDHSGLYHYHGSPTDFVKQQQKATRHRMALVGYAADGFPIYSEYGYKDEKNSKSGLIKLKSSYQLKKGKRPSDEPPGKYDGKYANDYEYVKGSGHLDECNGRYGITPDFPKGTYYYVITKSFPFVSRYWKGTPDASFVDRRAMGNNARGNKNGQGQGDQEGRRQGPPGQSSNNDRRPPPPHRRPRADQNEEF